MIYLYQNPKHWVGMFGFLTSHFMGNIPCQKYSLPKNQLVATFKIQTKNMIYLKLGFCCDFHEVRRLGKSGWFRVWFCECWSLLPGVLYSIFCPRSLTVFYLTKTLTRSLLLFDFDGMTNLRNLLLLLLFKWSLLVLLFCVYNYNYNYTLIITS